MAFCPFVFSREAVAAPATNTCKLPPGLSDVISKKYPGTSLVELTDLSAEDKAFFRKDHGTRCPGLVTVDFYGDGKPTWAVVLLSNAASARTTELLVARQLDHGWRIQSLDIADAAPVPVVWRQGPAKYQD